jgi:hypothetical protein
MSERQDKISQIIAICVKNNATPSNKNAFADLICKICAQRFGYDKKVSRGYIQIINTTWRTDKWKRYVENNQYLSKGEIDKWITSH